MTMPPQPPDVFSALQQVRLEMKEDLAGLRREVLEAIKELGTNVREDRREHDAVHEREKVALDERLAPFQHHLSSEEKRDTQVSTVLTILSYMNEYKWLIAIAAAFVLALVGKLGIDVNELPTH